MDFWKDYWDWIIQAIVVIVMVTVVGFSYSSPQGPEMVTAVGTAVLAIATAVYATEAYKHRKITDQMLKERNKEQVIKTIIYSIDPLIQSTRSLKENFSQSVTDIEDIHFGPPPNDSLPERQTISDIERKEPGMIETTESLREFLDNYESTWDETKGDLEQEFPDGDAIAPIHQAIEEIENRYGPNFDPADPIERLQSIGDRKFAYLILYNNREASPIGWIGDNWDLIEPAIRDVRHTTEFREQFAELERLMSGIEARCGEVIERSNKARETYKDEYDIYESEIEDMKSRNEGPSL